MALVKAADLVEHLLLGGIRPEDEIVGQFELVAFAGTLDLGEGGFDGISGKQVIESTAVVEGRRNDDLEHLPGFGITADEAVTLVGRVDDADDDCEQQGIYGESRTDEEAGGHCDEEECYLLCRTGCRTEPDEAECTGDGDTRSDIAVDHEDYDRHDDGHDGDSRRKTP